MMKLKMSPRGIVIGAVLVLPMWAVIILVIVRLLR